MYACLASISICTVYVGAYFDVIHVNIITYVATIHSSENISLNCVVSLITNSYQNSKALAIHNKRI